MSDDRAAANAPRLTTVPPPTVLWFNRTLPEIINVLTRVIVSKVDAGAGGGNYRGAYSQD